MKSMAIAVIMVSIIARVIPTDANAGKVIDTIAVGGRPLCIALPPDGEYIYVTNQNDGTVSVIMASSNTVVNTVAVGSYPHGMAANPVDNYVYVGSNPLSVINTEDNTVVDTIDLGISYWGIAITPDGSAVYVTTPRQTQCG